MWMTTSNRSTFAINHSWYRSSRGPINRIHRCCWNSGIGRGPRIVHAFNGPNSASERGATTGSRWTITPEISSVPGSYSFSQSVYLRAQLVTTSTSCPRCDQTVPRTCGTQPRTRRRSRCRSAGPCRGSSRDQCPIVDERDEFVATVDQAHVVTALVAAFHELPTGRIRRTTFVGSLRRRATDRRRSGASVLRRPPSRWSPPHSERRRAHRTPSPRAAGCRAPRARWRWRTRPPAGTRTPARVRTTVPRTRCCAPGVGGRVPGAPVRRSPTATDRREPGRRRAPSHHCARCIAWIRTSCRLCGSSCDTREDEGSLDVIAEPFERGSIVEGVEEPTGLQAGGYDVHVGEPQVVQVSGIEVRVRDVQHRPLHEEREFVASPLEPRGERRIDVEEVLRRCDVVVDQHQPAAPPQQGSCDVRVAETGVVDRVRPGRWCIGVDRAPAPRPTSRCRGAARRSRSGRSLRGALGSRSPSG